MTRRQRLAFLILQLNYGFTSWRETIRLARAAALGDRSTAATEAASAVSACLAAADAALASMGERELVTA